MELFEYIDMLEQPYDIFYSETIYPQLHWHYYSEIIFMEEGTVEVICNDDSVIIEHGDLCYIYPMQLHEIRAINKEKIRYAVIKYDIHSINIPASYLSKMYDYFLRRTREEDFCLLLKYNKTDYRTIKSQIDDIVSEYIKKDEFYMLGVQSGIHRLLVTVSRNVEKNIDLFNRNNSDSRFSFYHILEYIDTHLGEPLEVQKLAEMCHMSYSNFAKLFRENYGRSCKEYINYLRLNKAHDLLINSDFDLNYIAVETGFFDCSHFIRTYKKWRGITPKQVRMREKN
ncbi:MAG: helix-turn-helix domain-containing protein [Lachnospira sp.]